MTLKHVFAGTETVAEAPIDQDLMDLKVRENLEDLADQIDSISIGVGDGEVDTGAIGSIVLGGEDNAPRYWKKRFHPVQHMLNSDSENPSGFDPEGKSLKNELLSFIQSNDAGISLITDTNYHLGNGLSVAKDSSISFKIKKGVNFFALGFFKHPATCDSISILIDGATPSSLGLTDKNGNASVDSLSMVSATVFYQDTTFFHGLDGEEHIVEIKNTDSTTKAYSISHVEIGYRSENPTINEDIKINTGKALVRGSQVTFTEDQFSFSSLDKNGHTGSIICDTSGVLSSLDGESPAMTQVKTEESISFASAVTTLPVKNNFNFPESGIFLLSTPYGSHHLASYTGKTDSAIQSHSFDGLNWQSKPTVDYITLDNFSGAAGEATGDLNINYWGTAPILIDSTNNKIDFKVTIAGATTTHVATIASGRYAADLVPLEVAIINAMQSAKSINGEYHIRYNANTQLWTIYIEDVEVEGFELLFSTGASVANSVHITLGFVSTDLSGSFSYLASTEKQHLCCRVLERDAVYMHAEDPRIKYSTTKTSVTATDAKDIDERINLGSVRFLNHGTNMIQIFTDHDCCGLHLDFLFRNNSSMISVQIDDGQILYLNQLDQQQSGDTNIRGSINTSFITFPRGSRKITLRNETSSQFTIIDSLREFYFIGCRQYFTKPSYEKLTKSQSIIKTFDISPISLYATMYGHNGGLLYSPTITDNINTVTESGSWGAGGDTNFFNKTGRITSTSGSYVEVDFTLVGDGGGIALKSYLGADTSKVGMYLSQSAIVEGTDKIQTVHHNWSALHYDQETCQIFGLTAGTYKARFKNESTGNYRNIAIVVYDTVPPEENNNTVSDISGVGQSVTYPVNVRRESILIDSGERVPSWLERSGYKEGNVSKVNNSLNSPSYFNRDDISTLIQEANNYYGMKVSENIIGATYSLQCFAKSITLLEPTQSSVPSTGDQPFIDGIQTLNNYSVGVQVKGGTAPSTTRESASRLFQKLFELSCSHSAGLVFSISDTRGLKNDMTIILDDGVNKEKATIASFVVGVSFTIKKALTTVVAANVTSVDYHGFHNIDVVQGSANTKYVSCFEYEPLTISPSKALSRRHTAFKYQKVSITHRGVSSGGDIFYPVHSDGIVGNWTTSTIEVIGADGGAYRFDQDLKNITTTGDLDVKISSHRIVPVVDERERF